MSTAQLGQVTTNAAEVYEEFFVPALFGEWAPEVVDAADVAIGQHILDVACGTGVLAREAAGQVGPDGLVVGIDRNKDMLDVARRIAPRIDWRQSLAESLPFPNHSFDRVISQFGLMFFEDRVASLSEMYRVLRPGGKLAVAVWDQMETMPGYLAITHLLQELFGNRVTDALEAPFVLGNVDILMHLFAEADLTDAKYETRNGSARYPSIQSWIHTDIRGWTLAGMLNEDQFGVLLNAAGSHLKKFKQSDGSVEFASSAHIVTATKP